MTEPLARSVAATSTDPAVVARVLVDRLASPTLRVAFVFADSRLDPATLSAGLGALSAPVVGGTAFGVIGPDGTGVRPGPPSAVAVGLYGDWVRVGVGVASELSKGALARGRDAVHQAARGIGLTADTLDPSRHVALTLVDGGFLHEEAFCIGSAAAAPQIRFIGGGVSTDFERDVRPALWANGRVHSDAAVVVVLDSDQPFHAVTSSHLVPTKLKTVVTAATGRVIDQLDGKPAGPRLRHLVASLGDTLDEPLPMHAFARYIDGTPYVRSMHRISGNRLILAGAVEVGHILHLMRPDDLIRIMERDLRTAAERVGGTMAAFVAFSCLGRHAEAVMRGCDRELAGAFAKYPTVGMQSLSEQSGMLMVNHTLTGLAIGATRS